MQPTQPRPLSVKRILLFFSALFIIFLIFYAGVSLSVAAVFTEPTNNPLGRDASSIGKNYEDVSFTTSDNVHLKGWIFPGMSNKAVIMVPGLWQNRVNEDYNTVGIAKELISAGYTVMLFDLRGNGESEKVRLGYGFTEDRDLIAAVNVLKSKHFLPQRIGIIGDSLGAVIALHTAPQLLTIGAIVADSSSSDIKQLISDRMALDKHIPRLFHPGIFFAAEHLYGIPVRDKMPLTDIEATPERTYLFLHGEKDDYITPENSKLLHSRANMFSKLVLFKDAKHIKTYVTNPQLYRETVFSFLEEQLGK